MFDEETTTAPAEETPQTENVGDGVDDGEISSTEVKEETEEDSE